MDEARVAVRWGEPRRVRPADDLSRFSCGSHELDDYARRHALKNDLLGLSNCFLLLRPEGSEWPEVCGYFTLSMASVTPDLVAVHLHTPLPRYPTPVALIARLAVHQAVQRQKVGEYLLVQALEKSMRSEVGAVGVITDAKDARAAAFYGKYGFAALDPSRPSYPRRLFIARGSIPT